MAKDLRCKSSVTLLVGDTLRFTDAVFELTSGADGARCHVAFDDEELGEGAELEMISGPGGARGHLRSGGVVAPLFDEVELVKRAFSGDDDEEQEVIGLQGDFSFPHHGPFRRLRSVFAGVQDPELISALIEGWASDEAENVTHLPWTLESLTRFSAAHARTLPGVRDVTIGAPGRLTLHFTQDRSHYVDLTNLLANVRAEPDAAMERIADFFVATTPVSAAVDNGDVMFRLMRATPPVTLEAEVEGERHEIKLASIAVGPDLSAVFVRDSPRSIAYVNEGKVAQLAPDSEALMRLACENLIRSLPSIHIRGEGSRFMLIAGGDYECSLALVPELWVAMAPLLEGPPIVAMPSRDLCFITAHSPESIAELRARVDSFEELPYPISTAIYRVEKQGRWFEPIG